MKERPPATEARAQPAAPRDGAPHSAARAQEEQAAASPQVKQELAKQQPAKQQPTRPPAEDARPPAPRTGYLLLGAGSMLSSFVLSGFLLGYWTDSWLDTAPVFMIGFGVLGFVGGIFKVYKLLLRDTA